MNLDRKDVWYSTKAVIAIDPGAEQSAVVYFSATNHQSAQRIILQGAINIHRFAVLPNPEVLDYLQDMRESAGLCVVTQITFEDAVPSWTDFLFGRIPHLVERGLKTAYWSGRFEQACGSTAVRRIMLPDAWNSLRKSAKDERLARQEIIDRAGGELKTMGGVWRALVLGVGYVDAVMRVNEAMNPLHYPVATSNKGGTKQYDRT